MGALKEGINSLINKWQIHSLDKESTEIIQELYKLDDMGKIIALDKLNLILAKMNHLLSLEARKYDRRINNMINKTKEANDGAFERLGINNSIPNFADEVQKANKEANIQPPTINNRDLSFAEAVNKANAEANIQVPRGINNNLNFRKAIKEYEKNRTQRR